MHQEQVVYRLIHKLDGTSTYDLLMSAWELHMRRYWRSRSFLVPLRVNFAVHGYIIWSQIADKGIQSIDQQIHQLKKPDRD